MLASFECHCPRWIGAELYIPANLHLPTSANRLLILGLVAPDDSRHEGNMYICRVEDESRYTIQTTLMAALALSEAILEAHNKDMPLRT